MKDEEGDAETKKAEPLVSLRERTTQFALRIVRVHASLPKSPVANTIGLQVLRSGTSVGSQYREAHRARSDAEVISKLESVLQELDETDYWLELLVEAQIVKEKLLEGLRGETNELIAMLVTAVKKIKSRRK